MITQSTLKNVSHLLSQGDFGLEKENLRIDKDGKLALTPHPAIFGDKSENQYITTDFSESQMELITPPLPSIDAVYEFMQTLHNVVSNELGDEMLWPQSLPPILPTENQIPIAQYNDTSKELEDYRNAISEVYGKHRQMICGVHFNISLTDELFTALEKELNHKHTIGEIKEEVYLKITRGLMRYRWILVWMFGETPMAEPNFKVRSLTTNQEQLMCCDAGIALRVGKQGYRNRDNYIMDFSSLEGYNNVVDKLVSSGELHSAKELYLPVRMKFLAKDQGKPSYLEVRFLDLDPLSPSGIDKETLYATYLIFLYSLICEEEGQFDEQQQNEATTRQDSVSCYGRRPDSQFPNCISTGKTIAEEAQAFIQKMRTTLSEFGLLDNPIFVQTLDKMEHIATNPATRKGVILAEKCQEHGFIEYYLGLAKTYQKDAELEGYRFWGKEDMEMSTQLLMRAAICKGVSIEILDKSENFIRLTRDENTQLVVQATKTSLDNYATVLAMENKVVTKKLLAEHGIMVPAGGEYFAKQDALNDFSRYQNMAIVIKPKSTNFGIGITILKDNQDVDTFEKALDIAFDHDNCVLIEKFIEGREFRIFVIDNEVVGILHRVPANVQGDGVHTVRELVELKNQDPRRGKGYKTPLEKIALGEEESLFLELQGASFETVPNNGVKLYLRENSNISTGGDSLDFTDDVDDSYKAIAVRAAKAVNARITGVDMMIQGIDSPANEGNYSIIEINFNPAIHIHCFPYEGKNRRLNFKILDALGF